MAVCGSVSSGRSHCASRASSRRRRDRDRTRRSHPLRRQRHDAAARSAFNAAMRASTAAISGGARQVGLGQQDAIRHRDLPPRLGLAIELHRAVQRIHRRDDAVQPAGVACVRAPPAARAPPGPGSARPVVSMAMRRNGGSAPASRRCHSISSVSAMSPRTVQQMQPFFSSTASSIACSISRWSSPTAPNSLTITTVSASDGSLQQAVQHRGLAAAQEAGDDRHRHRVRRVHPTLIPSPWWQEAVGEEQSMAQPEAHNFRLIAHDTLAGFGNVGEGVSLQVATGGRRIMWMAHECAPKNFTARGRHRSDEAARRRADRAAASQRAFQLAGGVRRHHGGRVPDRHAWRDAGGDRAVRHLQAGTAAQHQLHRSLRPAVARRAPALVRRRQDDPLLQRRGGLHATQPEGRSVSIRAIDVSDPTKPRELGRWWYPGTRGARRARRRCRGIRNSTPAGGRTTPTSIRSGRTARMSAISTVAPCVLDISDIGRAEAGGALEPASAVPRLHCTRVMPLFDRDLLVVSDECVRDEGRRLAEAGLAAGRAARGQPGFVGTLPLPPMEDYAYRRPLRRA